MTVITPSYNRARMLDETIRSIYEQTYPSIELLIIDDGSEDAIGPIVASYQSRPGRSIRYVRRPRAGEAGAINHGWSMASGEFVAIVNSDDPQPQVWLSKCVAFMEAYPNAVVGYPDWEIIDEKGTVRHRVAVPEYSQERLVGDLHCLPGPGAILRRSLIGDGPLRSGDSRLCSDFECWLRLSLKGEFVHIPHCVARWRDHPGNLSRQGGLNWYVEMSQVVSRYFDRDDLPVAVQGLRSRTEGNLFYQAARTSWRRNPGLGAWFVLRAFLKLAPLGRFPAGHLWDKCVMLLRMR